MPFKRPAKYNGKFVSFSCNAASRNKVTTFIESSRVYVTLPAYSRTDAHVHKTTQAANLIFSFIIRHKYTDKNFPLRKKDYFCTMKRILSFWSIVIGCLLPYAGHAEPLRQQIRSLQVVVNDNPLAPPVMALGGRNHVCISFDELSHEYHRYIYKVEHCNADWSPSTEIFESDYLEGFNEQPIENYEKSFNTTLLYTHYRFCIPNKDLRLKLSGNYRVSIYNDEEGNDDEPVLQACFSVVEPLMNIAAQVSSNTDIDFNREHQLVSFSVNYAGCNVTDPNRELRTVVMQNRRTDNRVTDLRPDIQTATGVQFSHNRRLIFEAGNEFRKFEILDVHGPSMNVDRMEWFDPFYHATLYEDTPIRNYVYDEDKNGARIIRNRDNDDNATTCEYLFVHFSLKTPPIPGGDVYVYGQWTGAFSPEYKMNYNPQRQAYEAALLLKQGYYNYSYLFVPEGTEKGNSTKTDGNFYQTENEYLIFVYHRPSGGRYDKLAGFKTIDYNINH